MNLTKLGHACIRVDGHANAGVLVIDPGSFTADGATDGADAILITHQHPDHFLEPRIRAAADAHPGLQIWTVAAVADSLIGLGDRVHTVGDGDTFTAAGYDISAHGTMHAEIHPDIPRITNTGYLINGSLFHPGDALTVPDAKIDTLMLPVHAPWSRTADLIDWVRAVSPTQTIAAHDGLLNELGLGLIGNLLGSGGPGTGAPYQRLEPGATLTDI